MAALQAVMVAVMEVAVMVEAVMVEAVMEVEVTMEVTEVMGSTEGTDLIEEVDTAVVVVLAVTPGTLTVGTLTPGSIPIITM